VAPLEFSAADKAASSSEYAPLLSAVDAMTHEQKREYVSRNLAHDPSEYASMGLIIAYRNGLTLEAINLSRQSSGLPVIARRDFDPPLAARPEIERYEMQNVDYASVTEAVVANVDGAVVKEFYHGDLNFVILNFDSLEARNQAALAIIDSFPQCVVVVEPDVRLSSGAYDPGDEYFVDADGECWFGKRAGIEELWGSPGDIQYQGAGAHVAVIDEGFHKYHYEFDNGDGSYQWELIGMEDEPGIDYDLADPNDKDPEWQEGDERHGTWVMGLVNARAGNSGIAGIAFRSKVLPFRIDYGGSWPGQVNQALIQVQELVDVYGVSTIYSLNMSFGSPNEQFMSVMQQQLQDLADDHGIVPVACAHNANSSTPWYPAAWESVICVGGTQCVYDMGDRWRYHSSNYGSWVDIAAGAESVKSTSTAPDSFRTVSGTSFACPVVAAAAAIIKCFHPEYSVEQVKELLQLTSDRLDWGKESAAGSTEVFVSNFAKLRAALEQNIIVENVATYHMVTEHEVVPATIDVNGRMSLARNPATNLPAVALVEELAAPGSEYVLSFVEALANGETRRVVVADTTSDPFMEGIHGWTGLAFDASGTAYVLYSYWTAIEDSLWRVARIPNGSDNVYYDIDPQAGFAQGIVLWGNQRHVVFRDYYEPYYGFVPPDPLPRGYVASYTSQWDLRILERPMQGMFCLGEEPEQAGIMINGYTGNVMVYSQSGYVPLGVFGSMHFKVFELAEGVWSQSYPDTPDKPYYAAGVTLFRGYGQAPTIIFAESLPEEYGWRLAQSEMYPGGGWQYPILMEPFIPMEAFYYNQRFVPSGDFGYSFLGVPMDPPVVTWNLGDGFERTSVVMSFLGQANRLCLMNNNFYTDGFGPAAVMCSHGVDNNLYAAYYVPAYDTAMGPVRFCDVRFVRAYQTTE